MVFVRIAVFVHVDFQWFMRGGYFLTEAGASANGPMAFHRTMGFDDAAYGSRVVVAEYFCINRMI